MFGLSTQFHILQGKINFSSIYSVGGDKYGRCCVYYIHNEFSNGTATFVISNSSSSGNRCNFGNLLYIFFRNFNIPSQI